VEAKVRGHYPDHVTLEVELTSNDKAVHAELLAAVDRAHQDAMQQLDSVRVSFREGAPYLQIANLKKALAQAQLEHAQAQSEAGQAIQRAGDLATQGKDCSAAEKLGRERRVDAEIISEGIDGLSARLKEVEAEAKPVLRQQLEAQRQELHALALERVQHFQGKYLEAMTELLVPWQEALAKLRAVELTDHRRAPNGGPLRNPIDLFRQLP
jgi:hypothetical protein